MGEKKEWVDFKAIKEAVSMQMVLGHYPLIVLRQSGAELRGPCPIGGNGCGPRSFTVNKTKNVFKCFNKECAGHRGGNVLDFVAAKENCSVKDAALKLKEWFKVGESICEGCNHKPHTGACQVLTVTTPPYTTNCACPDRALVSPEDCQDQIRQLTAELDEHAKHIAVHTAQAQTKIAAIKKIVAALDKGG